jgi:CBS domain-containing protein
MATTTVADIMERDAPAIALEPQTPLNDAADIIVERGHSRLLVVEHGRHVGLVTRADVLAALSAAEA